MHVSRNFIDNGLMKPNYDLYLKTIGYYPDRLKNLYLLFSLVLKALHKAEPILKEAHFDQANNHIKPEILKLLTHT